MIDGGGDDDDKKDYGNYDDDDGKTSLERLMFNIHFNPLL